MPRYINADKLNKKKKYSFQTQGGCFPKSEWFIKADDFFAAPDADVVEVIHSKWELHKDGSGTCRQCGVTQKNVWDYDNWQNYCGHCGAKMDLN